MILIIGGILGRFEIKDFFNKYKGVRRLLLLWACSLVTYAVVVNELSDAFALGVIGLVATSIGFYQWSRGIDDKSKDD